MIDFYYPLVAFLIVPMIVMIIYYMKPGGTRNALHAASKTMIVSIILLAVASPYTVVEKPQTGSTDITIIADKTESMRLFDNATSDDVYGYLRNRTSAKIDTIVGTSSPIGDHIVRNVRPGGSILLISDGNSNQGRSLPEAISLARRLNATVDLLRQEPVKKDVSVSISGDPVAVIDVPSEFFIDINDAGGLPGDLEVRADNGVIYTAKVTQSERIPLKYGFNTAGSHTISAEIFTGNEDEFPQNNIFYKAVHAVPRPRILLVSEKSSPLSRMLTQSYSVDISPNITDPASYKAIVLDDMSAKDVSNKEADVLSGYVADGGGLLVVGGRDAYSEYGEVPVFEQLIPVKQGGIPQQGKSAGIVFILDISGSTGDLLGGDAKLGVEKGIALRMMDGIDADDFMGVIAFNNAPHTIVPFARYQDRTDVRDTVEKLRYGGTTHLSPALLAAHDMLRDFDGGRNVIVISDGIAADREPSLKAAASLADDGIIVYTIGVGGDTDEEFMKKLAASGGYLKGDQAHTMELLFGNIKSRAKKEGYSLLIINSGHFITRDAMLNASVYGYNRVFTKKNAKALVMTADGNPVISTWRFGLGRVVAMTADNGDVWAPGLYDEMNSKIISASVNYVIGSPSGLEIQAGDGEVDRPIDVRVNSDKEPELRFDGEQVHFSRTGEQVYSAEITPKSSGFHDLSGFTIAVNAPSEYRDLGENELVREMIIAAGGKVYNRSEIERIIPDIESRKTGMTSEAVDLKPLFLFAAVLLYTVEVILRRLAIVLR